MICVCGTNLNGKEKHKGVWREVPPTSPANECDVLLRPNSFASPVSRDEYERLPADEDDKC